MKAQVIIIIFSSIIGCSGKQHSSGKTDMTEYPDNCNHAEQLKITVEDGYRICVNRKDTFDCRAFADSGMIEVEQGKIIYSFENDTLKQTVELSRITKTEIRFKLISENKFRGQMNYTAGTAKNIYIDYDPEIDEDEEGMAYPVNEYIHEGDCRLSFRIEMDRQEKMQVKVADNCLSSNPYCPLASAGILRKQ
jgi:hypothetical protein